MKKKLTGITSRADVKFKMNSKSCGSEDFDLLSTSIILGTSDIEETIVLKNASPRKMSKMYYYHLFKYIKRHAKLDDVNNHVATGVNLRVDR